MANSLVLRISCWYSLGASSYLVVVVVDRSTQPEAERSAWRQNETTIGNNIMFEGQAFANTELGSLVL